VVKRLHLVLTDAQIDIIQLLDHVFHVLKLAVIAVHHRCALHAALENFTHKKNV
jgi:hypothetical protein